MAGKYLFGLKDLWLGTFVLWPTLLIAFLVELFGDCTPGSWFERRRYTTEVWVTASRDEDKTQKARVRALVEAGDDENGGGYRYRLFYMTSQNGHRVSFQDNDRALLKYNYPSSVLDDEHHSWTIAISSPDRM